AKSISGRPGRSDMLNPAFLQGVASPRLLPIATFALAIAIFVADTVTNIDIAVAVLYAAVVLMAARFCKARGVVLIGAGCVGLTALSYFLTPPGGDEVLGIINTAISIATIGLTTVLAFQGQLAEARLREQASLLELTHDTILSRGLDDAIAYWNRAAMESR